MDEILNFVCEMVVCVVLLSSIANLSKLIYDVYVCIYCQLDFWACFWTKL